MRSSYKQPKGNSSKKGDYHQDTLDTSNEDLSSGGSLGVGDDLFGDLEDMDLDSILGDSVEKGDEGNKRENELPKNKGSSESPKKSKKSRRQVTGYEVDKPLGAGRVVGSVFLGLVFSFVICIGCMALYTRYIRFPDGVDISNENTGIYCLTKWASDIDSMEGLGEDSFLFKEIAYANDDSQKLDFYSKMLSTVSYASYPVVDRNVYGYGLVDSEGNLVYRDSSVGVDEYVKMSYVDYDSIYFNKEVIYDLMESADLKIGDVDYSNKLVDIFCRYMNSLDELPIKTVRRVPYMGKSGDSYYMLPDEDVYLDRLLFSSEEFFNLLDRFSAVAGTYCNYTTEWEEWNSLSEEEKSSTKEPTMYIDELPLSEEWVEWNNLSAEARSELVEPDKYNWKETISKTWCGTFYLQNEYTTLDENGNEVKYAISAEVGDGSFNDPAGLNTDIVTSIFVNELQEDGSYVLAEYPIRVRMIEYGVSEDAIEWFESKSSLNRGMDVSSELQYCYYVFEVTNMSDKDLIIYDNSSLCDSGANMLSRTGTMYGLQDSVYLKPDETGIIESWGRSTELNLCYAIWGKDFERMTDPVWFRVLAGNVDDPTWEKGVTINKSRHEEQQEGSVIQESESSISEE